MSEHVLTTAEQAKLAVSLREEGRTLREIADDERIDHGVEWAWMAVRTWGTER